MDHERGFILEKQPEQWLPDGVMKDGKRAREQKKGSSTAAALSTATEEMKSAAAKEAKELKHLVMDSLKKQNGREATSTGTDMSEADEQELRALNALNVDM